MSSHSASNLDELLASATFVADPYPVYQILRDHHPVYWSSAWGVWVLSRYDDVLAVLRDPQGFSNDERYNVLFEQLPPDVQPAVEPLRRLDGVSFNIDPPYHTQVRRALRHAFLPPALQHFIPRVEELTDQLLSESDPEDFDAVRDLALPLPLMIISEIIGATREEAMPFETWAATIPRFFATARPAVDTAQAASDAIAEMEQHFEGMFEARLRQPRDDLLTQLLRASETENQIQRADLAALAAELVIAGHLATKDLIANALLELYFHPDARRQILDRPELIPLALEEVLRYDSPIQRGWRRVTRDLEIHGIELRRNDLVFLMFGAANRDPQHFADPDRFDIARHPNRHLTFGYGIHACLGAALARLEAPIALTALLRRAPSLEFLTEDIDRYPSIHVRGPQQIKLRLH